MRLLKPLQFDPVSELLEDDQFTSDFGAVVDEEGVVLVMSDKSSETVEPTERVYSMIVDSCVFVNDGPN